MRIQKILMHQVIRPFKDFQDPFGNNICSRQLLKEQDKLTTTSF